MKRLLVPLSVWVALMAAFILFQPSQALVEPPSSASSLPFESIRAQSSLNEFNVQAAPNPAWYDPAWFIRRPVTITNSGSALTNYQVLVTLNSTFDFNHAQADGADLRITAGDGTTALSFWIEAWDSTGQNAWVWVKVPSLPGGNTVIYLYYSNPSAVSASNGKATFEVYDGFESYAVGSTPTGDYSNPGEWTRYPSNPVLTPGPNAWDAAGATFASVISDTTVGQYRMYYHGIPASGPHQIGMATSNDGKTWTKYAGNPILTVGVSGAWDANGVRVPMVWKEGPSDYRMLYTGSGSGGLQVGYATSTNGIDWKKENNSNPVFNDPNSWAHNSTENWGVIKVDSQYLMWYSDLSAPRESSIATSTDLISWTPVASTPIFATSGVPSDYLYSQYCPFTFVYGGYYYVLVPSYTSVGDYGRYYLYRSSSPYFPTSDRYLVRVVHTTGVSGQWDALDSDTPAVLTSDIERSVFPGNQLWTYYAGASETGGTWREGLMIETNIAAALTDAALPGGTLSWTPSGDVTVVDSPVRQGVRSLQLNDTSTTGSTNIRGSFASIEKGSLGAWMRRDNTSVGDYDLYLYENSTLAAVVGLGRNGKFHYWNKTPSVPPGGYGTGFHDTAVSWSTNTWYLVSMVFDAASDTYDFVVYDHNLVEVVRQSGISFGNVTTNINAATIYTDMPFMGHGYADDYRLRKNVLLAPTLQVGAAQPAVELAITKTANAGTVYVGDTLIYTLRITNTGFLTAPAVFVTDTLPAQVNLVSAVPSQGTCTPASPVTCVLGDVTGGGSASITIIVTAATSGLASNTAEVSSTAPEFDETNNTATAITAILPNADLSVTQVDDPDPVWVGSPLSYTITVHNGGPSLAANVRLTDTLPSGVSFASVNPGQGTCTPGSPLTCSLETIQVGGNVVVTLIVTTTMDGMLTNQVAVGSGTHDTNPVNNTDSETTTVLPSADLSVTQVGEPASVPTGDPLTYTITVHNDGPSSSASVTLMDNLPPSVVFVSAAPAIYCVQASLVVCTLPGLPASSESQVQVVVLTTLKGLITNTVMAVSSTYDPNLVNNTSEYVTVVATEADLSVSQTDQPDPVLVEQELTYTLTVHNAGPSIAAFVWLTDTLPGEAILVSATPDQGSCSPGSVVTCELGYLMSGASVEVEVVVIPQAEGSIANTVVVATDTYEEHLADNTNIENTLVLPLSADLQLGLADAPDPVVAGALLTYTVHVANLGPSRAINPSVTIDLSNAVTFVTSTPSCSEFGGLVTCPLDEIPDGGSMDVTLTVRVSSSTFLLNITSSADVTSAVADPSPANNHASQATDIFRLADLAIDILDTPDPVAPGTNLTYTLVYTNSGPSDAINLSLTDILPANVDYVYSYPAGCISSSGTHLVTCDLSDLVAGHSAQIVLVVSVKGTAALPLSNQVEISCETPESNTDNNKSEETTGIDNKKPGIRWVTPVEDFSSPYGIVMKPGLVITLTAVASDTIGIDRVVFKRWDHVRHEYIEIGVGQEVSTYVYQYVWVFDSYLELPDGGNQIFAYAYDTSGNWERVRILILPQYVLLPAIIK